MWIAKAYAQVEEAVTDAEASADLAVSAGETFMMNMLLIGLLVVLFYFLMIRPQQKRMKTHQDMLSGLEKGTKIVTQGGLIGTIDKLVDDNEMVIKVGDVKINVLRSAVMSTYAEALPHTQNTDATNDTDNTKAAKSKKDKTAKK